MPPKGKSMSEKHKIAIREGVLTRMYGPEWRKVLTERRAAKSIEHILESEKIIKALQEADPKEKYGTPYLYDGPPDLKPMAKWEFMRILTSRLRDPVIAYGPFVVLASIYAEVRGWIRKRARHYRKGVAVGEKSAPPMSDEQLQELEETNKDTELFAIVQQLEEARKGKQNG